MLNSENHYEVCVHGKESMINSIGAWGREYRIMNEKCGTETPRRRLHAERQFPGSLFLDSVSFVTLSAAGVKKMKNDE